MKHKIALCALILSGGCGTVQEAYVQADRATHDLISEKLQIYLQNDQNLTAEERQRWLRLIQSWNIRILKWEEALKGGN